MFNMFIIIHMIIYELFKKNWIHFKGRQGECKWWILENEMQQTKHSELNLKTNLS